jgi:hypothetical protein
MLYDASYCEGTSRLGNNGIPKPWHRRLLRRQQRLPGILATILSSPPKSVNEVIGVLRARFSAWAQQRIGCSVNTLEQRSRSSPILLGGRRQGARHNGNQSTYERKEML